MSQLAFLHQLLVMWRKIIFVAVITATKVCALKNGMRRSVEILIPTNGCTMKRRSKENGDDDGYYCVCNMTYCDKTPDVIKPLNPATYVLITSSKSGLFFHVSNGTYGNVIMSRFNKKRRALRSKKKCKRRSMTTGKITINQIDVYQEILGFGGAVTDSAAMNINTLAYKTSDNLLRSYFGPHGINYNFIRVPMGGSDFSTRPYAYASIENDTSLHYFDLQTEDYIHKIPIIKRAQELKKSKIKLITAPWSPNPWMKTKNTWMNDAKLHPEYRQVWADYFVKYFEAYRHKGLEFWGTTCQNEPQGYYYIPANIPINGMIWTPEEERDWIIQYLNPTLKNKSFEHIKIFIMDDNRQFLPNYPKTVFQVKEARDVISGTAVHYYYDNKISPSVLDEVKQLFPEKLLIYTEACTGVFEDKHVILGSWKRGEMYGKNIIENLSHWVSSWIDWNIALNTDGGPSWIKHQVDSPIIVNSTANEFYKQPMFYVLGHFSKYIEPGSVRIGTTSENTNGIQNIAFSTPDGGIVLVILNLNEKEKKILVSDPKKGTTIINVLGKSINTMKYW